MSADHWLAVDQIPCAASRTCCGDDERKLHEKHAFMR